MVEKKRFEDLKTFSDWLEWKKADNKLSLQVASVIFILFGLYVGFVFGVFYDLPNQAETIDHIYVAACSAIGMENVNGYCIDSNGIQHKVLIDATGHAFIDGNRKQITR